MNSTPTKLTKTLAALIDDCKYEQAMEIAASAVKSFPNNPKIYALFASALRQGGYEKKALVFLNSALSKHSGSLALRLEYILLLYDMREYKKFKKSALELHDQILQLPREVVLTPAIQSILNQIAATALTVPQITASELCLLHKAGRARKSNSKKIKSVNSKQRKSIRIGIFSSQICQHVVGRFFTGFAACVSEMPWCATLYFDNSSRKHDVRAETKQTMAKFGINYTEINIEKNPHEAKKIIKADKLDLILELSGRFDGSYGRILNDRLATVQASWIGYPHHPGFTAVDFFLTDNFCQPQNLPPDEESKIYRFDRIFSSFDASHLEKVATSCQIPRTTIASKIRFVSLNHARKLNHDVLKLWAAALRRVPNSILTFKSSSITPYQEEWIISEFAKHGIAQDRLTVVRKNDTQEEHLNYLVRPEQLPTR
jgi:predicted O-linked N-acetylglucosamine transferase (SPINDLY family)